MMLAHQRRPRVPHLLARSLDGARSRRLAVPVSVNDFHSIGYGSHELYMRTQDGVEMSATAALRFSYFYDPSNVTVMAGTTIDQLHLRFVSFPKSKSKISPFRDYSYSRYNNYNYNYSWEPGILPTVRVRFFLILSDHYDGARSVCPTTCSQISSAPDAMGRSWCAPGGVGGATLSNATTDSHANASLMFGWGNQLSTRTNLKFLMGGFYSLWVDNDGFFRGGYGSGTNWPVHLEVYGVYDYNSFHYNSHDYVYGYHDCRDYLRYHDYGYQPDLFQYYDDYGYHDYGLDFFRYTKRYNCFLLRKSYNNAAGVFVSASSHCVVSFNDTNSGWRGKNHLEYKGSWSAE